VDHISLARKNFSSCERRRIKSQSLPSGMLKGKQLPQTQALTNILLTADARWQKRCEDFIHPPPRLVTSEERNWALAEVFRPGDVYPLSPRRTERPCRRAGLHTPVPDPSPRLARPGFPQKPFSPPPRPPSTRLGSRAAPLPPLTEPGSGAAPRSPAAPYPDGKGNPDPSPDSPAPALPDGAGVSGESGGAAVRSRCPRG